MIVAIAHIADYKLHCILHMLFNEYLVHLVFYLIRIKKPLNAKQVHMMVDDTCNGNGSKCKDTHIPPHIFLSLSLLQNS